MTLLLTLALMFCASAGAEPSAKVMKLFETSSVAEIELGPDGALIVAGTTNSDEFPATTGVFQMTATPGACSSASGEERRCDEGFVAKLSGSGEELIWATLLGGSGDDHVTEIEIADNGSVVVLGSSYSLDFPTTANAFQAGLSGPANSDFPQSEQDIFLAKIGPAGDSLQYSSFIGATGGELARALRLDGLGGAYFLASADGRSYPSTPGPFDQTPEDESTSTKWLTKIDLIGGDLLYSILVEPDTAAIDVDESGRAALAGPLAFFGVIVIPSGREDSAPLPDGGERTDVFVRWITPAGDTVTASADFNEDPAGGVSEIAFDEDGALWIAGGSGPSFPGLFAPSRPPEGFAAKLDSDSGSLLVMLPMPAAAGVLRAVPGGGVALLGSTQAGALNPTADAAHAGPCLAHSLIRLDREGSLLYATYAPWGDVLIDGPGPRQARVVQARGDRLDVFDATAAVKLGCFMSAARPRAPVHAGRFQFDSGSGLADVLLGTVGAADVLPKLDPPTSVLGSVSPGEVVDLWGAGLGPDEPVGASLTADERIPVEVAGTEILFDGVPAPVLSVVARRVRVITPFSVAGKERVEIEVRRDGAVHATGDAVVTPSKLRLFTLNGLGWGPGAILNQDGTLNSPDNPAAPGSVIQLFATGIGLMNPALEDGELSPREEPLPRAGREVRAWVQASPRILSFPVPEAAVLYAGAAPA